MTELRCRKTEILDGGKEEDQVKDKRDEAKTNGKNLEKHVDLKSYLSCSLIIRDLL